MIEIKPLKAFDPDDVTNAVNALKSVRSAWLRDPAVVAVDVGYKLVDGKPEDKCHLFFEKKNHNKKRLCTEEIAEHFEISENDARDAITKGLTKTAAGVSKEKYTKPWIRVHVDRRLTTSQVEVLGRHSYHHGLEFDGGRIEVDVVDALYKPLAKATGKASSEADGLVTQDQLMNAVKDITSKWDELQSAWVKKEELSKALEKEQRNRREADSRAREGAHEELRAHESDFENRIKKLEEKLSKRYALAHLDASSVERRGRAEPLTGGVSIGTSNFSCGTLSTIVWDKTDCKPCILGNWHILASGGADVGAACVQPSRMDGGVKPRDTVAYLKRWQLSPNVDAALAELNGNRQYAGGSILNGPEKTGAVTINGIHEATEAGLLGLPMWKFGRTSGLTHGFVDGVAMSLCVEYGDGTIQIFHDQMHIIPNRRDFKGTGEVSQAGDSGAVWLTYGNEAVGLQFAGDITNSPLGDFAVASPMKKVAEELKFSLEPVFLHPRVMEERDRDAELRAAISDLQPTGTAHGQAQELVDVLREILEGMIQRFDDSDVTQAMSRIRQILGPINLPETKPGGGPRGG